MKKHLYLALALAFIPATAVASDDKEKHNDIQLTCPVVKPEIIYVDKVVERIVYVDRVTERVVYVDKVVDKVVYVDKTVYVDKPIVQTVEVPTPVLIYYDKYMELKVKYDSLYKVYKKLYDHEKKEALEHKKKAKR